MWKGPIAFASRSLAAVRKNYSQLDEEALAVLFGVKKFHMYLYGHKFIIHKPLTPLLSELKLIHQWHFRNCSNSH